MNRSAATVENPTCPQLENRDHIVIADIIKKRGKHECTPCLLCARISLAIQERPVLLTPACWNTGAAAAMGLRASRRTVAMGIARDVAPTVLTLSSLA